MNGSERHLVRVQLRQPASATVTSLHPRSVHHEGRGGGSVTVRWTDRGTAINLLSENSSCSGKHSLRCEAIVTRARGGILLQVFCVPNWHTDWLRNLAVVSESDRRFGHHPHHALYVLKTNGEALLVLRLSLLRNQLGQNIETSRPVGISYWEGNSSSTCMRTVTYCLPCSIKIIVIRKDSEIKTSLRSVALQTSWNTHQTLSTQ
jgi:hypothetical protein